MREKGREGERESQRAPGSFILRAFKGGDLRGGPRRGPPYNTHQLPRCVLSGSWSPLIGQHQGRGSLVNVAGPDVSHCVALPGFAAFLDLELKHSRGLHVVSRA